MDQAEPRSAYTHAVPPETDRPPLVRADRSAAENFAQLAMAMHDAGGVEETVDAVVQFALQALSCTYAGVALYTSRAKRIEIPAVTDPVVAEIYRLQLEGQEGPLAETMRDRATVLVRDTLTETRWPGWASKVAGLGVRSVLDVPLKLGAESRTVGVLGLYSPVPDGFSADDEAIADILARHATVAVAAARKVENMAAAVDARKVVGQAMGILMERYDLGEDQAFAVLRRYSQDTNTKLHDVARQLIETRKLPTAE